MTGLRILIGLTVLVACLMNSLAMAQNPKPPTPLPPELLSVDQLPLTDAVVLWIDGNNITVYVDSTSNSDDQNKLTTLEIKWEGPGPGFVEENCPPLNDFFVCTKKKLVRVRTRGFGPVYSGFGNVIPEGFLETWSPETSWIVDGSYLTGETLDKFDAKSPYFGPIPEPSSLTLLCIGLPFLRRRL